MCFSARFGFVDHSLVDRLAFVILGYWPIGGGPCGKVMGVVEVSSFEGFVRRVAAAACGRGGDRAVVMVGHGGGGGFGRSMVLAPPASPPNPIALAQARFKELETGFRAWLEKQSMAVEAAVVTATNAAQGAAIGGLLGTLTSDVSSALPASTPNAAGLNPEAIASLNNAQVESLPPLIPFRSSSHYVDPSIRGFLLEHGERVYLGFYFSTKVPFAQQFAMSE
ncbi:hypothetical protein B296_00012383 [Ensete ventricosum]|uniref:Uncharacterized protein n=1 Tax=Ensete ventricosum TaxID=4639 RepID=A0A427AP30_ENSVE|nr:hypothetical protein B296_00012383 [Ensete ventricosum]